MMQDQLTAALQAMVYNSSVTDEEMIDYLLYYNENLEKVEYLDENMDTLLHLAAKTNRLSLASFLLHCDEQVSMQIKHRHLLLPHDPYATNMQGQTALHMAAATGHTRIVVLLLSYQHSHQQQQQYHHHTMTVQEHHPQHSIRLLQHRDHTGHSALYYAVMNRHYVLATLLVEQYQSNWLEQCNKEGNTLIQNAILRGDWETFQFLLSMAKESILHVKNFEGMDAFVTCACAKPNKGNQVTKIWNFFLQHYPMQMITSVDAIGRNVLYFACLERNSVFVELVNEMIVAEVRKAQRHSFPLPLKSKAAMFHKKTFQNLCFSVDSVFHHCPLSIAISKGEYRTIQTMLPHIKDCWNDKRFIVCIGKELLLDDPSSTSVVIQYVLLQILESSKNPSSAPLDNLVAICKLMLQYGATMHLSNCKQILDQDFSHPCTSSSSTECE